ncbi:MAG TPA: RNA methyltransferase [Bacillota bacterium]
MITSVQNEKVKTWRKLHTKKERTRRGIFLVEGFHLVEEAYKSDWEFVELIVVDHVHVPPIIEHVPTTYVSEQVFKHISKTKTPQGIAAVLKMKPPCVEVGNLVLLVDAIQDPGNLGTIIRTADAAGFEAIILGEGTVDLYNDKVIRATQGSLFHVPIFSASLCEKMTELKECGFNIWASALTNSQPYVDVQPSERTALIVGNEANGISKQHLKRADTIVKIPIYGQAESLNVSIAAGILMYYIKQT